MCACACRGMAMGVNFGHFLPLLLLTIKLKDNVNKETSHWKGDNFSLPPSSDVGTATLCRDGIAVTAGLDPLFESHCPSACGRALCSLDTQTQLRCSFAKGFSFHDRTSGGQQAGTGAAGQKCPQPLTPCDIAKELTQGASCLQCCRQRDTRRLAGVMRFGQLL